MTINATSVKICLLTFLCSILFGIEAVAVPSIAIKPAPDWVLPVTPGGKSASAKDFSDGYYLAFSDTQINLDLQTTYQKFVRQIVTL